MKSVKIILIIFLYNFPFLVNADNYIFVYYNSRVTFSLEGEKFSMRSSWEGTTENSIIPVEWYSGKVDYLENLIICNDTIYNKTIHFKRIDKTRLALITSREVFNHRWVQIDSEVHYMIDLMEEDSMFYLSSIRVNNESRTRLRFIWENKEIQKVFIPTKRDIILNLDSVLNTLSDELKVIEKDSVYNHSNM